MIKTHYKAENIIFKNFKSENNSTFSIIRIGHMSSSSGSSSSAQSSSSSAQSSSSSAQSSSSSTETHEHTQYDNQSFIITCIGDNVIMKSIGYSDGGHGTSGHGTSGHGTGTSGHGTSGHGTSGHGTSGHHGTSSHGTSGQTTNTKEYLLVPCDDGNNNNNIINDSSHDNPITCLLTTHDVTNDTTTTHYLFTCTANGLLSFYNININININNVKSSDDVSSHDVSSTLVYNVKSGHQAIVLCMASTTMNNTMTTTHKSPLLLATGSADSTIRVWNAQKGFITHNLKGIHLYSRLVC